MTPVNSFFEALNTADIDALKACLHPDFEMIVPQKPARGFVGRDQECKNMQTLFDSYPDLAVTVLRLATSGHEVWTETTATAADFDMAAVIIWTIDEATGTLRSGRYYAEPVQHDAPPIDDFIASIGSPA
jgi:ketosteroid isomerase-like protein